MVKRTKESVLKFYDEYIGGASILELNSKYSTDVSYLFNKYNLPRRTTGKSRELRRFGDIKLSYNFESIESQNQAYICGILLADGYIGKTQIKLDLKKEDLELIQKIRDYFSPDIKITLYKNRTASFKVSSKTACNNARLLKLGVKKAVEQSNIPEMNQELLRHFVRGYFDGDGSIFKCYNKYLKSYICSPTENILLEIQKILEDNNIESSINLEVRNNHKSIIDGREVLSSINIYRLFIRKKESLKRFYNFLYDNSELYMMRKKKVFDDNFFMLNKLR